MYQAGDLVVYGSHGVCRICGTEKRVVDRKTVHYYVLEPAQESSARFFVPSENKAVLAKMRPLMQKLELLDLLASEDIRNATFIEDEHQRKNYYRELISSCDCSALLKTVHTLVQHKDACVASGKKFHLCDENFLRDAQRILSAELSVVLQIPPSEVAAFVQQSMHK